MFGGKVFKYFLFNYLFGMCNIMNAFGFKVVGRVDKGVYKCIRNNRECYVVVKRSNVIRRSRLEKLRKLGEVYVLLVNIKGVNDLYSYTNKGGRRVRFSRIYPFLNGRRVQINMVVDGETYSMFKSLKARLTREMGRIITSGELLWILIEKMRERPVAIY